MPLIFTLEITNLLHIYIEQLDYYFKIVKTPVGALKLIASDNGLAAILWENDNPDRVRIKDSRELREHPILMETEIQLSEYFRGERQNFEIQLEFVGTVFQKNVWRALLNIPYGTTMTYGQLAAQLGNLKAVRAVGAANGRNPISIIAPCHRVIGATGALTGFAGGLDHKAFLLNLESKYVSNTPLNQKLNIFE